MTSSWDCRGCARAALTIFVAVQLASLAHLSIAAPVSNFIPGSGEQERKGMEELVELPSLSEHEMNWFSDYLTALLQEDPWSYSEAPLLYVEPVPPTPAAALADDDIQVRKRVRYLRRRNPYKRLTGRNRNAYDPDMYMCKPSRKDVYDLLMALHEAREGNIARTVNFCNRKRPAASVFTNIRFIGRRK